MTQVFGRATTRPLTALATFPPLSTTRRRVTAAAMMLMLLVSGLAGTQSAQAVAGATSAPKPAAVKPLTAAPLAKVKVTTSATRQVYRTTTIRVVATVSIKGHRAAGRVTFYSGSKAIATRKVKSGKATIRLSKKLSVGKHRITAKFVPAASTGAVAVKASKRIRVLSQRQAIVLVAKQYTGTPYRTGGKTPKGFDCSGFTSYVYKKAVKKQLASNSSAQRHAGRKVSRQAAKPGDIIWTPGHVAIYLGGNKQIDAPRPGKTIKVRTIFQSNPTFISVV